MICAVKRMPKKPTDKNDHVNQQPQRQMQPFLTHEISFSWQPISHLMLHSQMGSGPSMKKAKIFFWKHKFPSKDMDGPLGRKTEPKLGIIKRSGKNNVKRGNSSKP